MKSALLWLLLAGSVLAAPAITAVATAGAFGGYRGVAAPGAYIEIYGTNLAGSTRAWATSDFSGANAPTSLDGVTVTVNGTPAYVSYVSPGQINAEVPDSLAVGAAAVVVTYQGASATASLAIDPAQPGLLAPSAFLQPGGNQYAACLRSSTAAFATAASPAAPGETLTCYGIGFGPVSGAQAAGQIANGQTALTAKLSASIGGQPATVQYAGLAPGFVGLYQFNFAVPAGLANADALLQISLNGSPIALQTLYLPIAAAPASNSFTLTSSAGVNGGLLPADYTCDGMGSTIPLAWSNPPAGVKEFALLMTTLPGDGTTKWNWVLYGIPASTASLLRDSFLVGTLGVGSDGPGAVYDPPCSSGPGAKLYTYTLYALSASPALAPGAKVTGQVIADAIAGITLASASLDLSFTRTSMTGSSAACGLIRNSLGASKSGTASVSCDSRYAYLGSNGITTQPMMNGITSTNLQIPIPQNFNGANAWKIPLAPALAATPTTVVDGPLGVAINGVPIFNPCTQGGCVTGGDTKALGQLDACNGHAGRADDYHYHAAPLCMMADQPPSYWDTHPLGWALDGFAIFGYRDADGTAAQRDSLCGGNAKTVQNAPQGYSYHVTDASPYVTNCLAGTPSPDLAGQGAKYRPFRQPPVTPFNVSGMTLTTDPDGYQVLRFTSAISFVTNETGSDSYRNAPGTYLIRYKQVTGADLLTLLAQPSNRSAAACWNFQFTDAAGAVTQPSVSYCK